MSDQDRGIAVDPSPRGPLSPVQIDELYSRLIHDVREYAIFLLDLDGRVVSWNAGAESITGYTDAEILGRHYSVFYLPDEAAAGLPEEQLAAATRDGRAVYEGWRVRKDGSQFWASIVSTAILDDDGKVCGYGKVTRDLTERRAVEQENLRRSLHDALTDLPNRFLLGDRLIQALGRLERRSTCLAVLFVDLNDFKRVNDTLGHDSGDSVLIEAGKRLISAVRPDDTVARISGDEFVAVCENLDGADEAIAIADRIAAAFTPPVSLHNGEATISVSIGIAMTTRFDTSPQIMLRRADSAMYAAKRLGGTTSRVNLDKGDEAVA